MANLNSSYRRLDPVRLLELNWFILLGLGVAVSWLVVGQTDVSWSDLRKAAGPVSTVVAVGTLGLTTYIYARTSRRNRQALTFEAWGKWNDSTMATRRQMRRIYGDTMTEADGLKLAERARRPLGGTTEDDRLTKHAHRINEMLTGLERVATGWDRGIYDFAELSALGHQIIVRTSRRHSAYIRAFRQQWDHPEAFSNLEALAAALDVHRKVP